MFYHSSLLEPLLSAAALSPQIPVLYTGKFSYTAIDLLKKSKQLAFQLYKEGMRKDNMIVIAIAPGVDFITIMYASIMIRAKVAIIDPEMGRDLYRVKFNQLQPKWAFVDRRLLLLQEHPLIRYAYFKLANKPVYFPKFKGLKIIGCGPYMPLFQKFTPLKRLVRKAGQDIELEKYECDHDYLITYTSGTVQEPKGVLHSINALNKSIDILSKVVANSQDNIMATYLPHFALMGIAAQLPIFMYDIKLSTIERLEFFSINKITILFGPPSDFLPLIKHCELNECLLPLSLKHIILGSAPIHQSFLKRLLAVCPENVRLTIIYGMTENLLVSTVDGIDKLHYNGPGDLVGKPVDGVEIKIAEDGELLVKSEQLYSNYFHLNSRDEFHSTGDFAQLDKDGNILLMGRKKEMIIRGNTNIYPALYEGTIKKISGIDEVAMVGIYNPEKEDEEVFLAVETTCNLSKSFIMDKISYGELQIEKNALPDEIVFMVIPRKGRQNKIDRNGIIDRIKMGFS